MCKVDSAGVLRTHRADWTIVVLLMALLPGAIEAQAPQSSLIPLTAVCYNPLDTPASAHTFHAIFGNDLRATSCLDSISPTLVERPIIPDLDGVIWMPADSSALSCIQAPGFWPCDLRGVPLDPHAQIVYRFNLSSGLSFSVNKWVLSWPDSAYLRARCDSLILIDNAHGRAHIDMFLTDSLVLLGADTLYLSFKIYKYGTAIVDGIADAKSPTPSGFTLSENFPNPFNPSTSISYSVPVRSHVTMVIFNLLGQQVARLVDEEKMPGSYSVTWDASNVSSGVYYYRMMAGTFNEIKKMLLTR